MLIFSWRKLCVGSVLLILGVFLVYLFWPLQIPRQTQWIFYDRAGEVLFSEKPYASSYEDLDELSEWVIVVEDQEFYRHLGVDGGALFRAWKQNTQEGRIVSGASTITMQLARQLYLDDIERNWWYKVRQMLLALRLEAQYTKSEILNMYMRKVYLGRSVSGFSQASEYYFSKPLHSLSIGERALLVGILPRPESWNPVNDIAQAQIRRDLILRVWKERGLISASEYTYWTEQSIELNVADKSTLVAPHFLFWIKQQLRAQLPKDAKEYHIYTTLDKQWYTQVLGIARDIVSQEDQKNITNTSVVVLDEQAKIRVMLGSVDFFDAEIDGAVNVATSQREMGSTLKPFLFALALEQGYSPLDTVDDMRTSFLEGEGSYAPRNYNPYIEHGRVRFREALAGSYNIGAVDLLDEIGVESFYHFLQKLGFRILKNPKEIGLALVLGSGESRLLDLTRGFSAFLHRGDLKEVQFFTTVKDETQSILLEATLNPAKTVMHPKTAEWVLHALSDDSARWSNFPQGNALELGFPVAVKTGTSQDFRDNYVVGTSSEYTVGVWMGNTDGTPMRASSGLHGAGPLWHRIMRMLHPRGASEFEWISERQEVVVCRNAWEDQDTCTEKMNTFVLETEMQDVVDAPELSISFPSHGDIFHPDSSITVQVRNADGAFEVFLDGKPSGKILEDLEPGEHEIRVQQKNKSASITIFVADE